MFDHIDHIGVAVDDIEAALALYCGTFGLTIRHDEVVPSQGTRAVFLAARSGPDLELLHPLGPDTPVGRFLAKRGPGMHHLCYAVADLDATLARCQAQGLHLVDEVPRRGAGGSRLAFLHPKATGGVLIELYERDSEDDDSRPA